MTRLFDRFVIVDWSAANQRRRGRDSVWICEATHTRVDEPRNSHTRHAAMTDITGLCERALATGERLFLGFDFPFGYPEGAAQRLTGHASWRALWRLLHERVEDGDDNRSNRYELADALNRDIFRESLYWGRPHQHVFENLPAKKAASPLRSLMEFRRAERTHPPAKSVWQLAYNGAVGSQAILGIAHLEALRRRFDGHISVWPFDTGFDERLEAPIMLAEIYPSLIAPAPRAGEVKDSAQVRALATRFANLDRRSAFRASLAPPHGIDAEALAGLVREEGWIVSPGEAP